MTLNRSERTVKTALRELENAGLITRVRQGWNQGEPASFCKYPDRVQVSSRPEGNMLPNRMCRILPLAWGRNCPQVILIQSIKNIVRPKE